MTRHTKVEKEPETEVLTRKTRRAVAMKIADVDDALPVKVPLERKPRKKKVPGRKKIDKGDGLRELGNRYQALLRDCFGELNTDRIYDGFSVSCNVMLPETPGTIWVCAKLCKNGQPIHLREGYIINYPEDIRGLAIDLYGEMMSCGLDVAELLGL